MKVFISWSGEKSHKIAVSLRDWLPNVIQSVIPYVSSEDIDKGARWSKDIAAELADSYYGILCVTKDNLGAPWLNFEAGALSKSMDNTNVSPLLFDLKRSEVTGPILQFQSTILEKEDLRKLVHGINKACGESRLQDLRLDQIFEVWWPQLDAALQLIANSISTGPAATVGPADPAKSAKMLEEILELTRSQQRSLSMQERQLFDLVRAAVSSSDRLDRDGVPLPDHQVYRDLEVSWNELRVAIEALDLMKPERERINEKVNAFQAPWRYLRGRVFDIPLSTIAQKRNILRNTSE